MDKLYKIKVLHGAPKSSHTSIETYLIANNDEEVCDWINKHTKYGDWFEEYDESEPRICYADDNCDKEISFREWVMLNRGDLDDEEGWEDAYYGVTKWGWEEIKVLTEEEKSVLLNLNIAEIYE